MGANLSDVFQRLWPRANREVFPLILRYLGEYQINTPLRISHFLSQCDVESAGFRTFRENLNYNPSGLRSFFGRWITDQQAREIGRGGGKPADQDTIACLAYGWRGPGSPCPVPGCNTNRLGNQTFEDGMLFIGRGIKQLTGRANYTNFGRTLGMTPEQVVMAFEDPRTAMQMNVLSAFWFWNTARRRGQSCNQAADRGPYDDVVRDVTLVVNGGLNGFAERKASFRRIWSLIGDARELTSAPADRTRVMQSRRGGSTLSGIDPYNSGLIIPNRGSFEPLHPEFKARLAAASLEFKNATKFRLNVNSAFRSAADQERMRRENPEYAATGLSPHQTGIAVDLTPIDERGNGHPFKIDPPLLAQWNSIAGKYGIFQPLPGSPKSNKVEQWHFELDIGQGYPCDGRRARVFREAFDKGYGYVSTIIRVALNMAARVFKGVKFNKDLFREQMACDFGECECKIKLVDYLLVVMYEQLHKKIGDGLMVRSGTRCENKNKEYHGINDSMHLVGKAVDIEHMTKTSSELLDEVQNLFKDAVYAVAIGDRAIHVDVRSPNVDKRRIPVGTFTRADFACNCGCGFDSVDYTVVRILDFIKKDLNRQVLSVPGNKCSQHIQHNMGMFADFTVPTVNGGLFGRRRQPPMTADEVMQRYEGRFSNIAKMEKLSNYVVRVIAI